MLKTAECSAGKIKTQQRTFDRYPALARELGVSRQIIVGDIAILRAAGLDIYATPQGYTMPQPASCKIRWSPR